ncbi:ATP-binding protein [Siccirubricoccus sp. KC 17139]|uniref:histidine kinase n=1 Tax=Siccirubricoccus soli TaxID=2899147 RepID=A0ABT1DCK0_9PROT|nr:ATP-binding protein [Siccirubricoccus soli]MCO6419327.1 ATP-binding protein [Siccirubricoccus soli]MCP2685462.1 ATP-binding protein [Siccirubricoccus soli]
MSVADATSVEGAARRRGLPFRLHILGMALAALLPGLAACGLWLRSGWTARQESFDQGLLAAARGLAWAVEGGIANGTRFALARFLAADLPAGPGRVALAEDLRAPAELGLSIGLAATGETRDAAATGAEPAHRLALQLPVRLGDGGRASLHLALDPGQLGRLLAGRLPPQATWAELIDPQGLVVATTRDPSHRLRRPAPIWPAGEEAVWRGPEPEGRSQAVALVRLAEAPGWRLALGAPAPGWWPPQRLPGLALALLGLGALAALLLGRHWLREMARLAAWARAAAEGPPTALPPPCGIAEFAALAEGLRAATAALRQEAAAAQRERGLLRTVLDSTPNPVVVKGLDGRVELMNAAARRLHGRAAETMPGEGAPWQPPSWAALDAAQDAAVLRSGSRLMEEHVIPALDGRLFRITKTPLHGREGGPVTGIVTVMQDVTKQRRQEAELRGVEVEMQHLGRRATIGVMASGLAHELNQPLTAATNYLRAAGRLLEREDALRLDRLPVLREAVSAAAEQSLRAGEIVRRLREFLGRRVTVPVLEPVAAVVEEGVRLALPGLRPPDLEVRLLLPPGLGEALLDRLSVQQILVNLVRNAVEAMRGRARQELTIAARRLTAEGQAWVEISVADTGPGVPSEVAARLFEPFVGTKPDGLGVGLAICRRFAEGQGGRIAAARNPEGGMTFTLSLPVGLALPAAAEARETPTDAPVP